MVIGIMIIPRKHEKKDRTLIAISIAITIDQKTCKRSIIVSTIYEFLVYKELYPTTLVCTYII